MVSRCEKRMTFRATEYIKNPFCFWCGEWMLLFTMNIEDMATIEHLTPRSKGGSDKQNNLRLVHKRCNR